MYCTQADLENRISAQKLADLCNETSGATSATATIVNSLINKADAFINGYAGQVYTTPLYTALTGTIASSGVTLTGTSTLFLTELVIGTPLLNLATGELRVVDSITSDTVATTAVAFTTLSGATLRAIDRIIFDMSVDLSCYYALQRRFSVITMPDDWKNVLKDARDLLEKISNLFIVINANRGVSSVEADMVTRTTDPLVDFDNEDNGLSTF